MLRPSRPRVSHDPLLCLHLERTGGTPGPVRPRPGLNLWQTGSLVLVVLIAFTLGFGLGVQWSRKANKATPAIIRVP